MKNIQQIKNKKREEFAQRYYNKDYSQLNLIESKVIDTNAEIFAYIESIIPDNYIKYTIHDFTGNKNDSGTKLIDTTVARNAKDIICKYCWGKRWTDINNKDDETIKKILRNKEVIEERFNNGNNVVIYGSSKAPMGRTLIASIMMKEIIKMRQKPSCKTHTYDWVDFSTLIQSLAGKDTNESANYYACDWLVVDDINRNFFVTQAQKNYIAECISPFFSKRLRNRQPTILVFRFDITDDNLILENEMGMGISSIINNNRTFLIPLS